MSPISAGSISLDSTFNHTRGQRRSRTKDTKILAQRHCSHILFLSLWDIIIYSQGTSLTQMLETADSIPKLHISRPSPSQGWFKFYSKFMKLKLLLVLYSKYTVTVTLCFIMHNFLIVCQTYFELTTLWFILSVFFAGSFFILFLLITKILFICFSLEFLVFKLFLPICFYLFVTMRRV